MTEKTWGNKVVPITTGTTASEEHKDPPTMECVDNRIFFYSEVMRDKVLTLNKRIREMDNIHLVEKQNRGLKELPPIFIHINSFGGSIFSGLSAMDNILQCRCEVNTIVDGVCASAATFLSVVGKKRYITPHSFMLIHQLSSGMWGKYTEFKDEVKNLDMFMQVIKGIYLKYTSIPEKELIKILDHDLFFDAKTCLKYKLVDEILCGRAE